MSLHVSEIFKSIQGEGHHAGIPATFLRLQGCNLRCTWCDTPRAQNRLQGREMSCDQVLDELKYHRVQNIVVTGGEPLLQTPSLVELIGLDNHEHTWFLETNGTFDIPHDMFDWVCVSPKAHLDYRIPPSGVNELKFVITNDTNMHEIVDIVANYTGESTVSLQPVDNDVTIARRIMHYLTIIDMCSMWKLSLQLHKILEIE